MADAGIRVALLAKAGESRNQLRTALQDLGADLVCEGDPAELNPSALRELNPKVLVVSLEPTIEAALDKFDELLGSSNIEVVYDDAEVSGQLNGWDLNRWARHLAAKIIGTDLMPPVPAGSAMAAHDEWQPQPGAPETPAQAMADAKLEDYLQDTQSLATDVPVNESYSDALQRSVPAAPVVAIEPEADLDFNLDDLESALRLNISDAEDAPLPETKIELEKMSATADEMELAEFDSFITADATDLSLVDDAAVQVTEAASGALDDDFISFDNAQAEISDEISLGDDASFDIDLSALENSGLENNSADNSSLQFEDSASTLADFELNDAPVAFAKYQADDAVEMSADMDDEVAALAAQLDEFEKNDNRAVAKNMDFGDIENAPKAGQPVAQEKAAAAAKVSLELAEESAAPVAKAKPAAATKEARTFDLSGLSLMDMDDNIPAQTPEPVKPVVAPAFKKSSLSLEAIEGEDPSEKPLSDIGAVLILAGMGGPDAVRQLLKALPGTLNVPVLLYQHLEVGKHDRLVAQLQKVSNLPVYLAVQGQTAEPGQVAVMPVGVGLNLVENELFFGGADSQQELVATLPAKHSVVIVLSGAAYETAAEAAYVQSQGGLALAQDPTNCFEPAASDALVKLGGKTAEIPALAEMVLEYFKR